MSEPLHIRIAPQALAQIEAAADWWTKNRPAVPGAIRQDIAEMLAVLVHQPVLVCQPDAVASRDYAA